MSGGVVAGTYWRGRDRPDVRAKVLRVVQGQHHFVRGSSATPPGNDVRFKIDPEADHRLAGAVSVCSLTAFCRTWEPAP